MWFPVQNEKFPFPFLFFYAYGGLHRWSPRREKTAKVKFGSPRKQKKKKKVIKKKKV